MPWPLLSSHWCFLFIVLPESCRLCAPLQGLEVGLGREIHFLQSPGEHYLSSKKKHPLPIWNMERVWPNEGGCASGRTAGSSGSWAKTSGCWAGELVRDDLRRPAEACKKAATCTARVEKGLQESGAGPGWGQTLRRASSGSPFTLTYCTDKSVRHISPVLDLREGIPKCERAAQ